MRDEEIKKYNVVIGLLVLSAIYLALITLPINSNQKDIYIDATVYQPFLPSLSDITSISAPKLTITNIDTSIRQATYLSSPSLLGNIAFLNSGSIKLVASSGGKSTTVTADPITPTTDTTLRIVIKDVPLSTSTMTLKLYDNGKLVQTETVALI